MYSHEISAVLEGKNRVISSTEYSEIVDNSPQISRVKYNTYTNRFEIWTKDSYYFDFKVVLG